MDESFACFGIAGEIGRKELECDRAVEAGIVGFVDYTHPSFPNDFKNLIMRDELPDHSTLLLAGIGTSKGLETVRRENYALLTYYCTH
jgi:hypothetical protein